MKSVRMSQMFRNILKTGCMWQTCWQAYKSVILRLGLRRTSKKGEEEEDKKEVEGEEDEEKGT